MDYSLVSSDNTTDHKTHVEIKPAAKRKSKLKSYLPVLVPCLAAILILSILAGVWYAQLRSCRKVQQQTCHTTDCIITSGETLKMADLRVDPCTDFHEFACGRFNSGALLKPESGLLLSYSELFEQNFLKMYKLLTDKNVIIGGRNSTAISKVKQLFASCVNTEEIEKHGELPLLEFIQARMKGWPPLGNWNESSWWLSEALVEANKVGIYPFFDYKVLPNFLNSSEFEIKFMGVELSYNNKNSYNKTGEEGAFYKSILVGYIKEVAALLGAAASGLAEDAESIWELERKLAIEDMLSMPSVTMKQITDMNRTTVGEINQLLGHEVNLGGILSTVFNRAISPLEIVTASSSQFLQRVGEFIRETDKRTQANYVTWLAIKRFVPYANEGLRAAERTFEKALTGQAAATPRWKVCVVRTIDSMGFALSGLFIERYFEESAKQQVEEIFELIKASFGRRLASVSWLDEGTRSQAMEKLRKLKEKIGYPEFIKDARYLDRYYQELTVRDDYFQNALAIAAFDVYKQNSIYGKPRSKQEWLIPPVDFNAYYDRTSNTMVLLAGLLQSPLFSEVFPRSFNFGRVGFIIGHEIIHGFDSLGRLFNSDGTLVDWWSDQAEIEFDKRAECFVRQYSSFKVFERSTVGHQTLAEDIADNGGLSLAHAAYTEWIRNHEDLLLPGLNLSNEQQFFVAFGQYFCTYYRKERALELLETDSHSNNAIRLLGSVQNSKEFAEAFKCPKNSKMNPSNKCSIW